jgi:hypothetical protein
MLILYKTHACIGAGFEDTSPVARSCVNANDQSIIHSSTHASYSFKFDDVQSERSWPFVKGALACGGRARFKSGSLYPLFVSQDFLGFEHGGNCHM